MIGPGDLQLSTIKLRQNWSYSTWPLTQKSTNDIATLNGFPLISSSTAGNLGVIFDQAVSLNFYITAISRTAFFNLHNIAKTRQLLFQKDVEKLVHAFVNRIQNLLPHQQSLNKAGTIIS